MEINQYRRIRPLGLPDIDAFDGGRSVGESFGLADGRGCDRVVGVAAGEQRRLIEREYALIVHLVHLVLIVVEPDGRTLGPLWRRRWAALRRRAVGEKRDCAGGTACHQRATVQFVARRTILLHGCPSQFSALQEPRPPMRQAPGRFGPVSAYAK